jgi:hypothetical protein
VVQPVGIFHCLDVMKRLMEYYYKYHIRKTDIINVCLKTFWFVQIRGKCHFGPTVSSYQQVLLLQPWIQAVLVVTFPPSLAALLLQRHTPAG